MKGILGVYFVVKQEQRTKELVEMILLWLISLSVSHWGSSLLTRQGSETRVIRVLRHRVSRSNGSCICHGWLLGRSLMVTGVISSLEVGGVSYRACQKGLGNPWSRPRFNQEGMVYPLSDAVDTYFSPAFLFFFTWLYNEHRGEEGFKPKGW